MAEIELSSQEFWCALLAGHAATRGGAPAITRRGADGSYEQVSYGELLAMVRDYARLFADTTDRDQVIPLCLARGPECAAAMLGALAAGRAFCCINPKLRLPQLERILELLGSPIALIDGQGLSVLKGERAPASPVLAVTWYLVPGIPLARSATRALSELEQQTQVVRYERGAARERSGVAGERTDTARTPSVGCCLFTSGSTGKPKGVLISRDDLRARAQTEVAWFGLTHSDVLLNILPFSFDVGLNQLLSTLIAGAELVVLESWLPADVLAATAARGVTGIASVPTIWADFLARGRSFDRAGDHRRLRFLTVSGGDLSPAQHARLPELAPGVQIFKTYGQTEAFRITSLRPEEYGARPLSVGRALPGVRLYIVRGDGTLASPGEVGEVVHTGTGTMLAYLGGEDETKLRANPWHGADDPSPLAVFTGDLGQLDQEGYLQLVGRRDDLVKISGNRVYPSEVKGLITTLPGVASAEVVALRSEDRTQLAAFVIPSAGASLQSDGLRRQLQERAPSYMVPELLVLRSDLPRTASGKPDRTHLTEQALELLKRGMVAAIPLLSVGPLWS